MRHLSARAPLAALLAAAGCGGYSSSSSSSAPTCSTTTDVAITAAGFTPAAVNLPGGGCLRFTAGDAGPHQPASDPQAGQVDCPELNAPSPLAQGQTFTARLSGAGAKTCGFHDSLNAALRGTVTMTSAAPVDPGTPGY